MKKYLFAIITVLLCFCLFACGSEKKEGPVERIRLDLITVGMEKSEVRRILKVAPEEMDFEQADRYYLEDGRPVYVRYQSFNNNGVEQIVTTAIQIDELVDPALIDKLTADMTLEDVEELFSASGTFGTSGAYSRVYKLTDGRSVKIFYTASRPGDNTSTLYVDMKSISIKGQITE